MEIEITLEAGAELTRFELEKPVKSLWLSAEMKGDSGSFIYLFNPDNRLIGSLSLGISRFIPEIYISDSVCTMNGLFHQLKEGTYTLIAIPLNPAGKSEVTLEIETNTVKSYAREYCQELNKPAISFRDIINSDHRYYKGDFHGHTVFSDGHQTIFEAMEVLKKKKMDFMSFTEHNSMSFGLPELPCLSIPSFELTLPIGHMNIHGVSDLGCFIQRLYKVRDYETLWEYGVECFKESSNLSLNHMFMTPWHFTYEDFDLRKLNTLEVICDPTYPSAAKANDEAVAFLDFLWQEGIRIYGIGGSDSHNKEAEIYEGATEPSIYGDPATYVYCEGLSVQNILEGVKKGQSYVSRYGELDININQGKYLPGQQIPHERVIAYDVTINHKKTCIGKFILNGVTVWEGKLNENNRTASYVMKQGEEPWWLRFGLYNLEGHVIAYVNPIYNRLNLFQDTEFKILYNKFGEKNDQRDII